MKVETPSAHHVAVRNLVTHLVSHLRAGRNRDLLVGGALFDLTDWCSHTGIKVSQSYEYFSYRRGHSLEVGRCHH